MAPASAPASAEFCAWFRAVISMPTSIASMLALEEGHQAEPDEHVAHAGFVVEPLPESREGHLSHHGIPSACCVTTAPSGLTAWRLRANCSLQTCCHRCRLSPSPAPPGRPPALPSSGRPPRSATSHASGLLPPACARASAFFLATSASRFARSLASLCGLAALSASPSSARPSLLPGVRPLPLRRSVRRASWRGGFSASVGVVDGTSFIGAGCGCRRHRLRLAGAGAAGCCGRRDGTAVDGRRIARRRGRRRRIVARRDGVPWFTG